MDLNNERQVEAAFDQWLKDKNPRLFRSYDAMDMHIKGAMSAAWHAAMAQAIPEGFILVPKEFPQDQILALLKQQVEELSNGPDVKYHLPGPWSEETKARWIKAKLGEYRNQFLQLSRILKMLELSK